MLFNAAYDVARAVESSEVLVRGCGRGCGRGFAESLFSGSRVKPHTLKTVLKHMELTAAQHCGRSPLCEVGTLRNGERVRMLTDRPYPFNPS